MYEFKDWATADIVLIVEEDSLEKLFKTSGIALENYMVEGIKKKKSTKINISAQDLRELIFLWLNELIYIKDSKNLFFNDFDIEIKKNDEYKLTAVGYGEKFDQKRHDSKHDVKSCTYHKLEVRKINRKNKNYKSWRAQVVLDI